MKGLRIVAATLVCACLVLSSVALAARGGRAHRPKPKPLPAATVLAAASLTEVFQTMDRHEKYSFAGSDQLAFQIEQGAPADVFASANTKYPDDLYAKGLVFHPHVFATNKLVAIVPKANPAGLSSIQDLAKGGVTLVLADKSVPVGNYARQALTSLGLTDALKNVVSNEQDVKVVAGKVALNEADAGIVYATDVRPVRNQVQVIPIPPSAQPLIQYEIAVVRSAKNRPPASAFVRRVLGPDGRRFLKAFGFGLP